MASLRWNTLRLQIFYSMAQNLQLVRASGFDVYGCSKGYIYLTQNCL